jgi:hypothetical protein
MVQQKSADILKKKDDQNWNENACRLLVSDNANLAIFQLYHGENKLIFNEMMMRSTLY